jgi:hypothetical protein
MEPATVATEPAGRRPAVPGSAADGDLLGVDELLTEEERAIWDRVRAFCDAAVLPIINHYWERGRFPFQLVQGLARSRCGRPVTGYGCPGISPVASGLVAARSPSHRLARISPSFAPRRPPQQRAAVGGWAPECWWCGIRKCWISQSGADQGRGHELVDGPARHR